MIDTTHPLMKLGQGIDCEVFDHEFGKHDAVRVSRPATGTRLIVGLTYLQFMCAMGDEAVGADCVESPSWQHLTEEEHSITNVRCISGANTGCQWLQSEKILRVLALFCA